MNKLDFLSAAYGLPVADLRAEYARLGALKVNMITPSLYGSGVTELASTLNEYFLELGLKSRWAAIEAEQRFFVLSKKMTEALSLSFNSITRDELEEFKNLSYSLKVPSDCDILYMHDFHALIAAEKIKNLKKVYRCHFDISRANAEVWNFLKPYIEACDGIIFTSPESHPPLGRRVNYILPSIDPCSVKNTFVDKPEREKVLRNFNIPSNVPLVLQVSRFDRVKDPFGLIDVFKEVSKSVPSVLVYAGGFAPDDVNASALYEELKKYAAGRRDIVLLSINRHNYEIAALQSAADVVVQKSFSESFGLSVTEALWKGKPVAASDVGGIRLQIINNKTGLLCRDNEDFALAVTRLLYDKSLAKRLAAEGKRLVTEKFLITRELKNHTEIFKKIV